VWPLICAVPLTLTLGQDSDSYRAIFPAEWFDESPVKPVLTEYGVADPRTVKPLGLSLGILAVAVGQVFTVTYHALRRAGFLGATQRIQAQDRQYNFLEGVMTHFAQPEGFALIGGYLVGTWMLGWMPESYYSFAGGINWKHVAAQLLLQDLIQALMHLGEHKVSAWVYKNSHKPHHRFINPRMFDAFNGSLTDTLLMIIVPFVIVARLVPANVWSYMTFGSLYANWLVLIHSEFHHPWDGLFHRIGFGTAGDHHVHHRLFVYNFGHLFAYWDRVFGTYKSPAELEGHLFQKTK
jgi:sterol desaturase/sphingolipid hydroxylase (fatty acid hydroxylase superfamily)